MPCSALSVSGHGLGEGEAKVRGRMAHQAHHRTKGEAQTAEAVPPGAVSAAEDARLRWQAGLLNQAHDAMFVWELKLPRFGGVGLLPGRRWRRGLLPDPRVPLNAAQAQARPAPGPPDRLHRSPTHPCLGLSSPCA